MKLLNLLAAIVSALPLLPVQAHADELDDAMTQIARESWSGVPVDESLRVAVNIAKPEWSELDKATFEKLNRSLENALFKQKPQSHEMVARGVLRSMISRLENENLGSDPDAVRLQLLDLAVADAFVIPDYWLSGGEFFGSAQIVSVEDGTILGASGSFALPIETKNPCIGTGQIGDGYVCITPELMIKSEIAGISREYTSSKRAQVTISLSIRNQSEGEVGLLLVGPNPRAIDNIGNGYTAKLNYGDVTGVSVCNGSSANCVETHGAVENFTFIPPLGETSIVFRLRSDIEGNIAPSASQVALGSTALYLAGADDNRPKTISISVKDIALSN